MTTCLCVICQRREYERAMVCEADRVRIRHDLADIVTYTAELPGQLEPGVTGMQIRVSGSAERQLPIAIEPLDLSMPARAAGYALMSRGQLGLDDDQVGTLSVATVLDHIAQAWADTLGHGLPDPSVASLAAWLTIRVDAACDRHLAIDEDADELRGLVRDLKRACGMAPERPQLLDAPCRRCGFQATLHRMPGDDRVHCGNVDCRLIMSAEEYERWTHELAGQYRNVA